MPKGYMGNTDAAFILKLLSTLVGLWLWGLCLWFFIVSLAAHWQLMRPNDPNHHLCFDMSWFSFVFPNTALVTATFSIGKSLEAKAIQVFGTVLACILILVWIFVWVMMIRALWKRRLLWPGEIDGAEASLRRWAKQRKEAKVGENGDAEKARTEANLGGILLHSNSE